MLKKTRISVTVSVILIIVTSMSRSIIPIGVNDRELTTGAESPKIEMIDIPAGSFLMGSITGDEDETPVHPVTISKAFAMSTYEVTNRIAAPVFTWALKQGKITENNGWFVDSEGDPKKLIDTGDENADLIFSQNKFSVRPGKENYPCILISWFGCVRFCNFLSSMEKLTPAYSESGLVCDWNANGYRLPTEAEWEYAATGAGHGKRFQYAGSDDASEVGWFEGNEKTQPHPVGEKKPNGLGLFDMSGNVWECCWDLYGYYIPVTIDPDLFLKSLLIKAITIEQKDFISRIYVQNKTGSMYSLSPDITNEDNRKAWELFRSIGFVMGNETDPRGIVYRNKRVLKGGDWGSVESYLRPTFRGRVLMEVGGTGTGFRIVQNRTN